MIRLIHIKLMGLIYIVDGSIILPSMHVHVI